MYQKLMTKAIEAALPAIGATEKQPVSEKKIIVKYFTPDSSWTWYVAEGEPQGNGDWLFFGYMDAFEVEWGYFTLADLKSARGPFGLKIERDMHFDGKTFAEVVKD